VRVSVAHLQVRWSLLHTLSLPHGCTIILETSSLASSIPWWEDPSKFHIQEQEELKWGQEQNHFIYNPYGCCSAVLCRMQCLQHCSCP
jgi:hypothetical protein